MRSIDPNLLTLDISFDFCSIDIKNIIHHCGLNIDKKNKNLKSAINNSVH